MDESLGRIGSGSQHALCAQASLVRIVHLQCLIWNGESQSGSACLGSRRDGPTSDLNAAKQSCNPKWPVSAQPAVDSGPEEGNWQSVLLACPRRR